MGRIDDLLHRAVEMSGSDLHLKIDTGQIYVRVHGDLVHLDDEEPYEEEAFKKDLQSILRPEQWERFQRDLELDFAYELKEISRFRGNAFQQRNTVQAVFRAIPYQIQTIEDLQLPAASYDFIDRPRGLVLVTGPAGSGKSTSLAAMIDRINRTEQVHIMTVEDPVEFVHDDHVALINQRELEVDTLSFANALKYVLRQDPDVILVGEMRDLETIHLAITAAETGHLVFATLHTVDAIQTVDRIVDVFPMYQQQQVRMQLSVNLVGVISQTLVKRSDGRGRAAAFEVLVATGAVRNLIRENKSYQISSLIQTGSRAKMQTLDQSLVNLVQMGIVSFDDAKLKAKDPHEFGRMVALMQAGEIATPHSTQHHPVAPPPHAPAVQPTHYSEPPPGMETHTPPAHPPQHAATPVQHAPVPPAQHAPPPPAVAPNPEPMPPPPGTGFVPASRPSPMEPPPGTGFVPAARPEPAPPSAEQPSAPPAHQGVPGQPNRPGYRRE